MCPGTYFSNPELKSLNKVLVSCVENSLFTIKDTKEQIELSKIRCQEKIQPVTESFGVRCSRGRTELIQVVFHLETEFIGIYEVCYDKTNNIALFVRHSLDKTIADEIIKDDRDIARYEQIDASFNKNDQCGFRKRQLINPRDVLPGLSVIGTYNFMNLVPHWSTCNTEVKVFIYFGR